MVNQYQIEPEKSSDELNLRHRLNHIFIFTISDMYVIDMTICAKSVK